ncbi:ribokinase [Grosmannia clavigera kw1407]|uniref:Ribokinase n=1 Tax=Grosmannia clavigera (strain kw1407 / UAMH 11150) TaxID=655863 RepID=F0XFG6_GROCL|nr:ribokinase [Grosmannia clavigera kw1407]EFX03630.1 ribokinase [Grosmannia clavigera kw1407]
MAQQATPCSDRAKAAGSSLPWITVLGSLNMDLVSYVSHHPQPGETMMSSAFATSPGGKGANQAVACAKLSRRRNAANTAEWNDTASMATAHVAMVGAVGDDANGATLRANLARHGVDVQGVQTVAGQTTGVAVIVVDEPTGQNRIILSPGANYAIPWRADLILPQQTQLLILQLEIPLEQVEQALTAARTADIPVLFNPAPAPATEETRAKLEAAFSTLDDKERPTGRAGLAHLVLNETETAALAVGCTVSDLDTTDGLARAARYFLDRGVENVVMTLGGRGVYYASRTAGGPGELLPPEPVAHVVDTTGAGDTFAGQYALEVVHAAAEGKPFDCAAAVRRSNKAAAKTVQRRGAQDSIPWRDEVE